MERILNVENDWDHNVAADIEDPVDSLSRDEVLNEMKTGNEPAPSDVPLEFTAASIEVGS